MGTMVEGFLDLSGGPFRDVVVARLVEGMSVEETAELFGILPQTVKTRLHRARASETRDGKALGRVLGDAFPSPGVVATG
jgi:RNA polymerase sigma-70 factor (ECF subfamily)